MADGGMSIHSSPATRDTGLAMGAAGGRPRLGSGRWLLAAASALLVLVTGCGHAAHEPAVALLGAEPPLKAQVEDVRSGLSEEIEINNSMVTDQELRALANLRNLRSLRLDKGHVTDAGVRQLVGLTNLESLIIGTTEITDAGFAKLCNFTNLRTLNLGTSLVHDAALANLRQLDRLELLRLGSPYITDAGLGFLSRLEQLRFLILRDAKVTDAGIVKLAGSRTWSRFTWNGRA